MNRISSIELKRKLGIWKGKRKKEKVSNY